MIEAGQHVRLGYQVSAQGSDLKIRLDLRLVLRLGAHIVKLPSVHSETQGIHAFKRLIMQPSYLCKNLMVHVFSARSPLMYQNKGVVPNLEDRF